MTITGICNALQARNCMHSKAGTRTTDTHTNRGIITKPRSRRYSS
ncbi:hypothetical protein HMPREF3190_00323 [Umbribacter vaginalis]|nr:hypothetical protein HMPREF3190_00323 [Coriobacteriales bacterium DNF00809]